MSVTFNTNFFPVANVGTSYNYKIEVTGGQAPYAFAILSGSLPTGLTMSGDGIISGTPTEIGLSNVVIEVSDSTYPVHFTTIQTFQLTTLDIIDLSALTVDQAQFVQQFQEVLGKSKVWSTGITTQTSQTLIELISAIGTFVTARTNRVKEDAFYETAQSDSAILAITNMQGLRLARKLPATVPVTLSSSQVVTISPYTQFSGGGYNWFNDTQITIEPGIPVTAVLREGKVSSFNISGLGSDLQTWVSSEDGFTVSDHDVVVRINGAQLLKSFGGLWNYPRVTGGSSLQLAFADRTLSDGRLLIQFGSAGYGAIPGVNDVVNITYAVTQGASMNSVVVNGSAVTAINYPSVTAKFVSNPSGGADQKPTLAYKNFGAGTFGTFGSGVTKSQYHGIVNNYPGIVDAITQSQREVNPSALAWMNVIRVSALTSSTWTQTQIEEFLSYIQSTTMYSTNFVWQDPEAVPVDVDLSIFCFNSVTSTTAVKAAVEAAITKLLTPRPGLLLTDMYESDLIETAFNAAPGQISYVTVNKPTQPMIVSGPKSPRVVSTVNNTGGYLEPMLYSYAISANTPSPSQSFLGLIDARNSPRFPNATAAGQYWIISYPGLLKDPLTNATVAVDIGDQVLANSLGNSINNFTVVPQAQNGVVDTGVPTTWTFPQVYVNGSSVLLDWSASKVPNAIQYFVWGRKANEIGIITQMTEDTTAFLDTGLYIPPVTPVTAYSTSRIRYNSLGSLNVTANYAARQNNALFPVRDTL